MEPVPDILNYGGFGAAILLVLVVGRFAMKFVQDSNNHQRTMQDEDRRLREEARDREFKLATEFIKVSESQRDQTGALTEVIEANTEVIDALCVEIRNNSGQHSEEHKDIRTDIRELRKGA